MTENVNSMCRFLAKLTPRQHKIYGLVCDGLSNKEIAAKLCRSQRTVEIHRALITEKAHAAGLVWRRTLVKRVSS